MSKIIWRHGDDWQELVVDGVTEHANHSIPRHVICELLRKLGHDVEEAAVEFCRACGEWILDAAPYCDTMCAECAREGQSEQ